MGSRRLPGKSLCDVVGRPMLARVIARARAIRGIDRVVVATTPAEIDQPILALAVSMGVDTYIGSESDVLDRYYQAAGQYAATTVMRLTGDCPLLDPAVSGRVLASFRRQECDYASNIHPPTFPDGLDTEVMSYEALEQAWMHARLPAEREHVTPYIWTAPQRFRVVNVTHQDDLSGHRWTVDEPADLEFVRRVYAAFGEGCATFGMTDILALLSTQPDLVQVNAAYPRNAGYAVSVRDDDER
jgi:spore coat polysaccharide biosynthesis protein SpsF